MRQNELRDALHKVPFVPVRLHVSGGATFDIRHPELCVPGMTAVFIGFPVPGMEEPSFERFTLVDLNHIIRLEPLPSSAATV